MERILTASAFHKKSSPLPIGIQLHSSRAMKDLIEGKKNNKRAYLRPCGSGINQPATSGYGDFVRHTLASQGCSDLGFPVGR